MRDQINFKDILKHPLMDKKKKKSTHSNWPNIEPLYFEDSEEWFSMKAAYERAFTICSSAKLR